MITTRFHGQLGNNLFQLAALLGLKEKKESVFLLDAVHRGNIEEIGNLFLHPKKLEFNEMFEHKFDYLDLNYFNQNYSTHFELIEHPDLTPAGNFGFSEIKYKNFSILNGYYQSEKYFSHASDKIKNFYFQPSEEVRKSLNNYDFSNSLSIHYRRGGDRHLGNMQEFFKDLNFNYYVENIRLICNLREIKKLFIFSDDIKWCKNNLDKLIPTGYKLEIIFIENNKNYVDLFLMSKCENNIIANSTFSWWSAWLNHNPEKIVIAPKTEWFGPRLKNLNLDDLFPEEWIKI